MSILHPSPCDALREAAELAWENMADDINGNVGHPFYKTAALLRKALDDVATAKEQSNGRTLHALEEEQTRI